MTPLVTGTIGFKSSRPPLTDATVSVRLEDVSRADASAIVVAETMIENPADCATVAGIPFTLTGNRAEIDPQRRYSVAVHVDMDASGDVTVGDYINTTSYPVSIQDTPATLTVIVEQVGE